MTAGQNGQRRRRIRAAALLGCLALGLAACEGARTREIVDTPRDEGQSGPVFKDEYEENSIFGKGGLTWGGKKEKKGAADSGGGGLGVNSFLWRATLDTISFMPVASADPFGGVVITDWHAQPEAPDERFKLNVYILGRALRADGVRVAVFRQVRKGPETWVDAPVPDDAGTKIEDAILMRARQLRHQTVNR